MASPTPVIGSGKGGGGDQPPRRQRSLSMNDAQPFTQQQQTETFDAFTLIHQQMVLQAQKVREEERARQLKAQTEAKIGAARSYQAYLERGRQRVAAATAIQALVRGRAARQEFLAQREAAITLQSQVRGFLARREYERQQEAAQVLQSAARGMAARRELDALVKQRDDAFAELDAHVRAATAKWGGVETRAAAALPCDKLLSTIASGALASALGAMAEIQTNKEWAGYTGKLAAIKVQFDRVISDLKQRLENDKVFLKELRSLSTELQLVDTSAPNSLTIPIQKLSESNVAKLWGTLVALMSAVNQNVGEFCTCMEQIKRLYEPPKLVAKAKKAFNREDPNTWELNAISWHARVTKGTVEAVPQWTAVEGKLKTASLTGRTITKTSVMKTDWVMHEHLGGDKGIGFCYLKEDDGTVTPWVLDYASSRDGNTYWWGSGKRDGDPNVALPAKKT